MGGILINAGVINYGGTPSIGANTSANRPGAGVKGKLFIDTTNSLLQYDTGSAWVTIGGSGPSGSGSTGQATFWTGASVISGDNAFFWDNTNKRLGLGTATPGVRLDIHGTGVLQQLNGTTTNNAYLDFQNAGTTQIRIGNNYNAGTQLFQIIDQTSTTPILSYDRSLSRISFPASSIEVLAAGSLTNNGTFSLGIGNTTVLGYIGDRTTVNTRYIKFNRASALTDVVNIQSINGGVGTANLALNAEGGNVGIGTNIPAALLSVQGSGLINTNTANALYELFVNGNTYTGGLSPTNSTVAVNTAMARTQTGYVCTATLTLTLPAVSGLNNIFYVVANTGATVTVQRNGSDTILDKTGTSQTSVTVAAGTRSMFYCGGGSITYQIF